MIVERLDLLRMDQRNLPDLQLSLPAQKALRSIGDFRELLRTHAGYFWIRRREFLRSFAVHSQEVA